MNKNNYVLLALCFLMSGLGAYAAPTDIVINEIKYSSDSATGSLSDRNVWIPRITSINYDTSENRADYEKKNLIDGMNITIWRAGKNENDDIKTKVPSAFIDFALPQKTLIHTISITDYEKGKARNMEVYVSDVYAEATRSNKPNNDASFGSALSISINEANGIQTITLPANTEARYVRLKIGSTADGDSVGIRDINMDLGIPVYGEFVELYNKGASSVNLSGWRLSNEVDYTFPAGTSIPADSYLIVAADPTNAHYTGPVVGPFVGKISSSKGTINLKDTINTLIDSVDYKLGFPWPVAKGNGASIELIHPDLPNQQGGSWRSSMTTNEAWGRPSPGAQNGSYISGDKAPILSSLDCSPQEPASTDNVVISIKVADAASVQSVALHYQVVSPGAYIRSHDSLFADWYTDPTVAVQSNEGNLPMSFMGLDTDGKGIYSVTIPASTHNNKEIVRYRISAEGTNGQRVSAPYADDDRMNFAYHCYDGVPAYTAPANHTDLGGTVFSAEVMEKSLPVYHLYTNYEDNQVFFPEAYADTGYDANNNTGGFKAIYSGQSGLVKHFYLGRGTFVYDGIVYDHIKYRPRGETSTAQQGDKTKLKIKFNTTQPLAARDNRGNKYKEPWSKINLLNCTAVYYEKIPDYNPRDGGGLGGAFFSDRAAFKLMDLAGLPTPQTHYLQLRVSHEKTEDGTYEPFHGVWLAIQQQDDSYMAENDLPEGNVYNLKYNPANSGRRFHTDGFNDDATDFNDLVDLMGFSSFFADQYETSHAGYKTDYPVPDVTRIKAELDIDSYINWLICSLAFNNADLRPLANVVYFKNKETGKWQILPWDLDFTFEEKFHNYHFGLHWSLKHPYKWQNFNEVFTDASVKQKFNNRARELEGLLFNNGDTLNILKELQYDLDAGVPSNPISEADRARWEYDPETRNQGSYYHIEGSDKTLPGMITFMDEFLRKNGYGGQQLSDFKVYEHGNSTLRFSVRSDDSEAPSKPTGIVFSGDLDASGNYLPNQLAFSCDSFAANTSKVQWRIAEYSDVNAPGFDPSKRRKYEMNADWTSASLEVSSVGTAISVPPGYVDKNKSYRVRVRIMDADGDWSYWSEPLEFVSSSNKSELYISEVMAHSDKPFVDAIELHNDSASNIDLSGWWLSDKEMDSSNFVTTNAWQIPAGTTIAKSGYITFVEGHGYSGDVVLVDDQTEFGSTIRLSSLGDRVILYTPNKFKMDDFSFDGTYVNSSIGLHMNTDGARVETLFGNQTLVDATNGSEQAAPNGSPAIGDVVISELMYNPKDYGLNRDFEFVELYNRSGNTIDLYNSDGDPWAVSGIGYSFPSNGISMPPLGIILLVKEKKNTPNSDFFQKYSLTTNQMLQVIFHDEGKLANDGEMIKLMARDDRGLNGNNLGIASEVAIDRVGYKAQSPWSTDADGMGYSLERTDPNVFGNQSLSWATSQVLGGSPGIVGALTIPAIGHQISTTSIQAMVGDTISDLTLLVRNAGGGILNYTLSELSDADNMLQTITPLNGSLDGPGTQKQHTISLNSGLSAGSYTSTLRITAGVLTQDVTILLNITAEPVVSPLKAFNDLRWDNTQSTAINATKYSVGTTQQYLKDINSGAFSAVTVSIAGSMSGTAAIGKNPVQGTAAHTVFDGMVDCTGIVGYGSNQAFTFEGLDPAATYTFAFYGDRDNYDNRNTQMTIHDATGYVNTSTVGANGATTLVMNGRNSTAGELIRYEQVIPSAIGTVSFTVDRPDSSDTYKSYLNAFMVAKITTGGDGTFATWAGDLSLSGNADADFDGDGIKDFIEYALNMDPKFNDVAGKMTHTMQSSGDLLYRFAKPIADVSYKVQYTTELGGTWTDCPETQNDLGSEISVLIPSNYSNAGKLFIRLRIQQ